MKKWVFRILQGLLAVGFIMAGMSKFAMGSEGLREAYTEPLGYGEGFMYVIAVIELLSVAGLIAGFWKARWTFLGAAALTVIMTGATVSVLLSDMAIGEAASPFICWVVALVLSIGSFKSVRQPGRQAQATL